MELDLPFETTIFLLLFARVGAVLLLLPVFGEEAIPGRIRLLLALAMTLALDGLLRGEVLAWAGDTALLPRLVLVELARGLALGSLVRILFQSAAMAGGVISLQTGLTSALIFDPGLGGQVPVLSKLLAIAAALACLSAGLHHAWIGALVKSYSAFPVGAGMVAGDWTRLAVGAVGQATLLALEMAAPFLVYGIVFNVALGLAARLSPAIQIFFIAQPLNLLLGLALLVVTLGPMISLFTGGMSDWLRGALG